MNIKSGNEKPQRAIQDVNKFEFVQPKKELIKSQMMRGIIPQILIPSQEKIQEKLNIKQLLQIQMKFQDYVNMMNQMINIQLQLKIWYIEVDGNEVESCAHILIFKIFRWFTTCQVLQQIQFMVWCFNK